MYQYCILTTMSYKTNARKMSDIKLGSESERFMLPHIRKLLKNDLIEQSQTTYSPFDYYSPKCCVELKTRFCPSTQYSTTMIPLSKVKACTNADIDYWFFFRFSDGISYIKYDKDLFDTFEKKIGGRADRGCVESNDYVYIPMNKCLTYYV
jgi:hypothetical protein